MQITSDCVSWSAVRSGAEQCEVMRRACGVMTSDGYIHTHTQIKRIGLVSDKSAIPVKTLSHHMTLADEIQATMSAGAEKNLNS